jgi:macrolide transport system ATP-binding/permease protein
MKIFEFFRRKNDLKDEIESHLKMATSDRVARGESPDEARRAAVREFGNVPLIADVTRERWGWLRLEQLMQDLRFALRQLGRNPGFAFTAIAVLTLGIGAGVAIFAFVDAALIKPMPYADPARLVSVYEVAPNCPLCNVSFQNYLDWKKSNLPFSSLQVWGWASYLVNTPQGTEPVRGARVSDGFYRTLGVTPMLGRDFYPGEDLPGAPHTILISYDAWQKRFGANPSIVGQAITLSNVAYTIIGVLPQDFHFAPLGKVDFWAALNEPTGCDKRRACHGLFGLARLNNGASLETAVAGLQTQASHLANQYPDSNHGLSATATSLSEAVIGDIRPVLLVLLSGAFLLLLIACVNVSGLLLVRSEGRKRETAVRSALGATPARLFRQFVIESIVLVLSGTVLGVGSSYAVIKLLVKLVPGDRMEGMPFLLTVGLTPQVLGFAGAIALLATAVFAITPAMRMARGNLRGDLAEGGRGSAGNAWRRLGSKLIILELATAVVLLVGAGLLSKSLYRLLHVEIGMRTDHLATLVVATPRSYVEGDRLKVLERQIIARIGSLPGVQSAGISSHRPLRAWDGGVSLVVPGRPSAGQRSDVPERDVSAGYLSTVGATLLRGRYFTEDEDDDAKPRVIVVNRTFSKQFFPGENPIGKHIAYEGSKTPVEIIGEVEDLKEGPLDSPNQGVIYVPFNQDSDLTFNLVVRTRQSEDAELLTLASAIHEVDATIATSDATTMSELLNDSTAAYLHRSSAWLVGGFAALALVLSVVGLYGVIAYSVSQRTREIGVRMALGAERSSVYRLILKEAGWLTAIGIVAGLCCSVAAATLMRKLLFGTQAWDATTLAAVAVALALSAMLASYLPARRAASVNPAEALRAE